MKKVIALLVLLFCLASVNVFASDFVFTQPEGRVWYTYPIDNTSGIYIETDIPITTIIPKGIGQSKILGFTVMSLKGHAGITGNSENVASLWDGAPGTSSAENLGEAESVDESFDGMWFPIPKILETQLSVRQGGNTRVIVYFE